MAIFHLRARSLGKGSGSSAAASAAYILRLGKYAKAGLDPCIHSESKNMPAWAAGPRKHLDYWKSADQNSRVNSRLAKGLEFSLPVELSHDQRLALAREFCTRVATTSTGEPLPFVMAVHHGGALALNPHVHVLLSQKIWDGYDRSPELWFSRAAPKDKKPESGGARATNDLRPREWLLATRELLARLTNEALAAAGFTARVDHRSLLAQGIERPRGLHLGPAGAARLRRGAGSRRAEDLAQHQAAEQEAKQLLAELRKEARAVELELANTLHSAPVSTPPTNNSTTAMLARAQRQASQEQQDAAAKKPERRKSNDFEFRP
ncbi:MobA/MobL family protein [Acidovorax sp. Q11]